MPTATATPGAQVVVGAGLEHGRHVLEQVGHCGNGSERAQVVEARRLNVVKTFLKNTALEFTIQHHAPQFQLFSVRFHKSFLLFGEESGNLGPLGQEVGAEFTDLFGREHAVKVAVDERAVEFHADDSGQGHAVFQNTDHGSTRGHHEATRPHEHGPQTAPASTDSARIAFSDWAVSSGPPHAKNKASSRDFINRGNADRVPIRSADFY